MGTRLAGTAVAAATLLLPSLAIADATPDIDGDLSDWPADPFTFQDESGDLLFAWRDIEQIWVTDDNSSGSDGNLYLALDFRGSFRESVFGVDIDVFIYLDVDGDGEISGPDDRIIEATEGEVTDGDGNAVGTIAAMEYSGSTMEVSIPYSVLGLTSGNDTVGVATATNGWPSIMDHSPETDADNGGFITYDGAAGDDIEPLSVTLAALGARSGPKGVTVSWSTGSERNNVGFHVYRQGLGGALLQLTEEPIAGLGDSPIGRDYEFVDGEGRSGWRYFVEDLDASGSSMLHGPVQARHGAVRSGLLGRLRAAADRRRGRWAPGRRPRVLAGNGASRRLDGAVKLAVHQPGANLLSWATLAEAGLERADVERRGLLLSGREGRVPTLASERGLWFVGLAESDRYSDHDVLFARLGRAAAMRQRRVFGDCSEPSTEAPHRLELEQQRVYYVKAPDGDPFFWAQAFPGWPARLTLPVPTPQSQSAELELSVLGLSDVHAVAVQLNGADLGEVSWVGKDLEELRFTLPAGLLLEGDNQLTVSALPGADFDVVSIDTVRVEYTRRLVPVEGQLSFSVAAGQCVQIEAASGGGSVLLDVTEPLKPIVLHGFQGMSTEAGAPAIRFVDEAPGPRRETAPLRRYLLADLGAGLPTVEFVGKRQHAALGARWRRGDYLIITHPEFAPAARRLAEYHSRNGLSSLVATTEEVYDEFSHGRAGPDGIRRFVRVALERWQTPPRYLLLMGGSTVDGTGHLEGSPPDYVPTHFTTTLSHGYEAAADGWYVEGDSGVPRLAVGRLAVSSPEEAERVVDKILAGHQMLEQPTGRLLFVADSYAPTGTTDEFQLASAELADACVPVGLDRVRWLKSSSSAPPFDLRREAEAGIDLLSYHGHGFLSGWSSSPILVDSVQAGAYDNERPFLLLSWTCFDGGFVGPWGESLAWSFVRNPTGGALLATASTTLADPVALSELGTQVLCRLTRGESPTVGDALLEAERALAADASIELQDLLHTYSLLGDPATPNPWAVTDSDLRR